jgi:ubiquinone/menaquinone biosynthesis C-methylase UbiE
MKDERSEFHAYYDERAPEYDEIYMGAGSGMPEPETYRRDVATVSGVVSSFGRGHLIDIGCGTGYWFPYYVRNCSEVTLIDQSRRMLVECQKKVSEQLTGVDVHFVRGDFFDIRFLARIFDSSLVAFVISHLTEDNADVFFEKLTGILKTGSEILWIDGAWSSMRENYREKIGLQTRTLNNGRSFTIYKRYFDERDINAVIKKHSLILRSLYLGDVFFAARAALQR